MASGKKLRTDWIALLALAVSVAAVAFTAAHWWEAHTQRLLGSAAHIGFDIDTDPSNRRLGISLRNVGPGVAQIRSVTFYVNGKPTADLDDALKQFKLDPSRDHPIHLDVDDAIASQEVIALIDYRPRNSEEYDRASDVFENQLGVAVNYCSIDHQCATKCSTKGTCGDIK